MARDHVVREASAKGIEELRRTLLGRGGRKGRSMGGKDRALMATVIRAATMIEARLLSKATKAVPEAEWVKELQGWELMAKFHAQVAAENNLPENSLEAMAQRIRVALGDGEQRTEYRQSVVVVIPDTADEPEMLRTCHGLARVALTTAPADFALHAALAAPIVSRRIRGGGGIAATGTGLAPHSRATVTVIRIPLAPGSPDGPSVDIWMREGTVIAARGTITEWGPLQTTPLHSDGTHGRKGSKFDRTKSRFLHEDFRWKVTHEQKPDGSPDYASGLVIKNFDPTGVMRHASAWHGKIKYLSSTCRIILAGKVHLPAVDTGLRMTVSKNLASIEYDKPLLMKLICKYLISGVLEYCEPACPPTNLIPLGLVPKNCEEEPWRVILDARECNKDLLGWESTMFGIHASASLFTQGSVCFMKDISAAYHNVLLGSTCGPTSCLGCKECRAPLTAAAAAHTGEGKAPPTCAYLRTGLQSVMGDMRPAPGAPGRQQQARRRYFNVCRPGLNCRGACQKQSFGIQMEGELFRFAVCPFGVRSSGNVWAELLAPLIAKYRARGISIIIWVDDLLALTTNQCQRQETCGGRNECPECASCWAAARGLEAEFEEDLKQLGFETNSKNVPPTTRGVFLGLGFCTVKQTFWVPPEKAAAFALLCRKTLDEGQATKRELAALVGKLSWWAPALQYVQLLTRAMLAATGGAESPGKWEQVVIFDAAVIVELTHWQDNIVQLAQQERAMIPPRAENVKDDWLKKSYGRHAVFRKSRSGDGKWRRLPHQQVAGDYGICDFLLSTDAGPKKWGATLRSKTGGILKASGEYPTVDTEGIDRHRRRATDRERAYADQQPWREAFASKQGLLAFERQIAGKVVLHEGDCKCVVKALKVGSSKSAMLHDTAVEIWREAARMDVSLFSGWVPGKEIIKSGSDGLSREDGYDWGGLSARGKAWDAVESLLKRNGWRLTVDLFASQANAKTERFYSLFHEPAAEMVDAFKALSWGSAPCQGCRGRHRETVLAFPPHALLMPAWARLRKDKARGIFIMKKHLSSPAFPIMLDGKIGRGVEVSGEVFGLPAGCEKGLTAQGVMTDTYIIVAFDFLRNHESQQEAKGGEEQEPCGEFSQVPVQQPRKRKAAEAEHGLQIALAASTRNVRRRELEGVGGH